jgi:hypothetical protein
MRSQSLALLPFLLIPLLFSCNSDKEEKDTGDVDEADADTDTDTDADADADTGDTGDTGTEPTCTTLMTTTVPEDGTADFYWKSPIVIDFDDEPEEKDIISITDADGSAVGFTAEWDETHGETVTLTPELSGSTEYTVAVNCLEPQSFGFTTSAYGLPLTIPVEDLVGRTYELDLPGAYFKHPVGIGALLSTYLENPLLVSPVAFTDTEITMLAARGLWDDEGVPSQDMGMGTFPFLPSDWTGAPFFSGDTEEIIVSYDAGSSTTDIIIHSVHLEGTFAADGSSIGGAWASGLADTRNLYTLIDVPDMPGVDPEDLVCAWVESLGLPCIDCGDGVDRCLYMEAYFDDAPLVEGVILDPDPTGRK